MPPSKGRTKRAKPTRQRVEKATPAPVQTKIVIRCPSCRVEDVIKTGDGDNVEYYRCCVCGDLETHTWTRFKVRIDDPLAPAQRIDPAEARQGA